MKISCSIVAFALIVTLTGCDKESTSSNSQEGLVLHIESNTGWKLTVFSDSLVDLDNNTFEGLEDTLIPLEWNTCTRLTTLQNTTGSWVHGWFTPYGSDTMFYASGDTFETHQNIWIAGVLTCGFLEHYQSQDSLTLHIESNTSWHVWGEAGDWNGFGDTEIQMYVDYACVNFATVTSVQGEWVQAWFTPIGEDSTFRGTGSNSAYERNRLRNGIKICGFR